MARPIQSGADGRLYLLFGFGNGMLVQDMATAGRSPDLRADGTLDTGWGDGGVVVIDKGGPGYWNSVPTLLEPLADGRIVALTPTGVLTRLLGGHQEGHGAINIAAGLDVVEDAPQISIEVTRTGGSAGAVSVEIRRPSRPSRPRVQRPGRISRRRAAAWIGRMVTRRPGKSWFRFSRTRSNEVDEQFAVAIAFAVGRRRAPEHEGARAGSATTGMPQLLLLHRRRRRHHPSLPPAAAVQPTVSC